jgi:hypothetical protein
MSECSNLLVKLIYLLNVLTMFLAASSSAFLRSPSVKRKTAITASKPFTVRTALDEHGLKGEFVRKDASWRNWVSRGTFPLFITIELFEDE